ncbi:hypothetical protein RhiirA4_428615 [Rhizophagus irregularis]|uniref:SWIM-type domain-containing protein n=1 Tax=Rhizophagus irregularis TaxID=588596 RepID=A0A2I1HDM6_9GLOM|nr:hypothetical protein RhiirA4_428615 [Rhizophagus irregularis]
MSELFSPSSFNINNINIPEEFGLSRELFFFDNPESIEEYEQDRFEQSNSDNDNNSHESIDENINIYENQNQPPDSPVVQLLMSNVKLSLDTNLMFENWEEVELFVDIYSEQQGFENKKVRTEKDKDGQIRKRRFDCEHSGKYKPKKIAIIENQRNSTSKKTECGFRVNFSYTRAKGFISITNYVESHNGHDLNPKFVDFYSKYRKMTDEMMKQIRLFTKCNLDMAQQRSMLKELFPNRTILAQDLSNAIQRVKYEYANTENDVWKQLKEQYPTACDYLTRALEPSQKSWARCYTATTFVAGVQSTQRVEGYNSVIKRVVNGNTTLWQLAQYLNERISIEMQKIEYQEFKDSNALVGLPNLATQLFPRIDQMIKTYLTPELLSLQRAQMNQATLYYCRQLAINEIYIAKHQEAGEFGIDFIENYSESRQMELNVLIAQCGIDLVTSVWEIKRYNTTKINYIILLNNRTHMCTCMTLITMGIYCRHFFQVMLHTTEAFFYIKLIPIRWFKDNYMQMDPNIVAANEPFITTQGDHVAETNYMTNGIVFQIRGDLNNDEEKVKTKARRIRDLYGKISSVFKEALKKAIDDEDFSKLLKTLSVLVYTK